MVVSSKRTGVFVSVQTIHRLYTEQKNERAIIRLVGEQFENFTMQPVMGFFDGSPEKSIVVEIVGATPLSIRKLAARIKKMNGQKSILTIRVRGDVEAIRW
jgi:hypothetical protein